MPRHRSPRAARVRSGSNWSSSQRAFAAENIGSSGSPLRSPDGLAGAVAASSRHIGAVRWSCQLSSGDRAGSRCGGPTAAATRAGCSARRPAIRPWPVPSRQSATARRTLRPDLLGRLLDPAPVRVVDRNDRRRPAPTTSPAGRPARPWSRSCPGRWRGSAVQCRPWAMRSRRRRRCRRRSGRSGRAGTRCCRSARRPAARRGSAGAPAAAGRSASRPRRRGRR